MSFPSKADVYFSTGRSSDFQAVNLLAAASQALSLSAYVQLSFLVTAAGQSRIQTGFPLATPRSLRWKQAYRIALVLSLAAADLAGKKNL